MSYAVTINGHHHGTAEEAGAAEKELHKNLARVLKEHQEVHGGDAVSYGHFSGSHINHTLVGEHAAAIHEHAHGEHHDPETGRFVSDKDEEDSGR